MEEQLLTERRAQNEEQPEEKIIECKQINTKGEKINVERNVAKNKET